MVQGRRVRLTRWACWAAAFALLSPDLAIANPVEAGWVNETIPKRLLGGARESALLTLMQRRIMRLAPRGRVETQRLPEAQGAGELYLVSSKTGQRHHYLLFVHAYRRVIGGFGPVVRLCRVSLDADAKSFLVATDILRNGDCRADAKRSTEYHHWVARP